jgi:hypothetical protein
MVEYRQADGRRIDAQSISRSFDGMDGGLS